MPWRLCACRGAAPLDGSGHIVGPIGFRQLQQRTLQAGGFVGKYSSQGLLMVIAPVPGVSQVRAIDVLLSGA
jgi:hypothetical protein